VRATKPFPGDDETDVEIIAVVAGCCVAAADAVDADTSVLGDVVSDLQLL